MHFGQPVLNIIRGALMGAAEAVPGVSGGTVALVTGVYDRLIDAAGDFLSAIRLLVRGAGLRGFRQVAWGVVLPVLAGMAAALLIFARIIPPLLEAYPAHCYGVFFGMILASLAVPFRGIGTPVRLQHYVLIVVAAVAAGYLTGLAPGNIAEPPMWLVFISAALAINALVLPGVSGSFVMLVIGIYTPTLAAVNDRDLGYIGVFALGAIIGLASFVKGLQWLLHHHHRATLAVMTGLMIGSLRGLWPWQDFTTRALQTPSGDIAGVVALMAAGFVVVAVLIVAESRIAARPVTRSHG